METPNKLAPNQDLPLSDRPQREIGPKEAADELAPDSGIYPEGCNFMSCNAVK